MPTPLYWLKIPTNKRQEAMNFNELSQIIDAYHKFTHNPSSEKTPRKHPVTPKKHESTTKGQPRAHEKNQSKK